MERKVGEVFTYNGKTFIVEPHVECTGCYFTETCDAAKGKTNFGECAAFKRIDNTDIIFKELKENMETKELKVQIPEGYEIDKEKSTFENIVFKKVDNRPKSWKEYLDKVNPIYFINKDGNSDYTVLPERLGENRLCFDNRELTEKVIAYAKLLALREEWIKGEKFKELKFNISLSDFGPTIFPTKLPAERLTFPTEEMADEFIKCFRDLLEKAEGLY